MKAFSVRRFNLWTSWSLHSWVCRKEVISGWQRWILYPPRTHFPILNFLYHIDDVWLQTELSTPNKMWYRANYMPKMRLVFLFKKEVRWARVKPMWLVFPQIPIQCAERLEHAWVLQVISATQHLSPRKSLKMGQRKRLAPSPSTK